MCVYQYLKSMLINFNLILFKECFKSQYIYIFSNFIFTTPIEDFYSWEGGNVAKPCFSYERLRRFDVGCWQLTRDKRKYVGRRQS